MAPKKKQTSVVPMDASATARKSVTADAEPSKKKTEAWGATTSSSSSASVTNAVAAAEPAVGTDHRVYLSIPYDLCGLVVSSWLVPTVKRPLRGVKTFIFAALVQTGVLGYMLVAMWTADPAKSPCPTPALLQLLGLYIFMAAMATELNSVRILQIALVTTKLKVPGGPELEAGTSRKLVMGKDLYIDVRPSSRKQRYLLALAPLTELVIEIATLCIGSLYLVVSESIEDLILNAVAVNFVTQSERALPPTCIPMPAAHACCLLPVALACCPWTRPSCHNASPASLL